MISTPSEDLDERIICGIDWSKKSSFIPGISLIRMLLFWVGKTRGYEETGDHNKVSLNT